MRLDITSSLQTSHDVGAYAESRLRSAFAAFAEQVESVKVSVSHTGDHDETPIKCRIKVRIHPSGIWLILETRGADPYAAIDRGVDGIQKSFMRWLARASSRAVPVAV